MALDQESGIEAEGREGREAAKDSSRKKQPEVLVDAGPEGEIAGKQAHRERTDNVHDQRSEREAVAEQPRRHHVDPVTESAADPGAEEDDQIEHNPPTAAELRS